MNDMKGLNKILKFLNCGSAARPACSLSSLAAL